MKFRIVCISDSDKHFASAISEYIKRLGKEYEIITLKPEKNGTREQIIHKETTNIVHYLEKKTSGRQGVSHQDNDNAFVVLLAKEGKQLSTESFGSLIQKQIHRGCAALTFIIGGPYGFDNQLLLPHVHYTIAFGEATMPHGLAKLVLLEQLYRAKMIQEGKEYHY